MTEAAMMIPKLGPAVLALLLAATTLPAEQEPEFNLSMDQTAAEADLPNGWDKIGTSSVTVENDPENETNRFLKIDSGSPIGLGVVRYFIPVKHAGEQVELTGKVKVKDVGGRGARLRIVFFKNGRVIASKATEPITGTSKWKDYTVSLAKPKAADRFALVGLLSGKGTSVRRLMQSRTFASCVRRETPKSQTAICESVSMTLSEATIVRNLAG